MGNEIKINDKTMRITEWQGEKVITTKDIADLHGLEVSILNRKYRRNKSRYVEGVDYFEVRIEEIKSAMPDWQTTLGDVLYKNTREYLLFITESGYLNFVKILNDDIAWDIYKKLKNVYFKAKKIQDIELRKRTKEVRNAFTAVLKERGYEKKHHYIQTTQQMKKELDITAKKDEMTEEELIDIQMAELLSRRRLKQSQLNGYHEVNPVCLESTRDVKHIVNKNENNTCKQLEGVV